MTKFFGFLITCSWVALGCNSIGSEFASENSDLENDIDSDNGFICPPGFAAIEPGEYTIGETDPAWAAPFMPPQQSHSYVFLLAPVRLEKTECISQYLFPGEGKRFPRDGMTSTQYAYFERTYLEPYGYRFPTATAMLIAGSSKENCRFAPGCTNDWDHAMCEQSDQSPTHTIGYYTGCVTPYGIHDYSGMLSAIVRLDHEVGDIMRGRTLIPSGVEYAVLGGTARKDTFYAWGTRGFHFHVFDYLEGNGLDSYPYLQGGTWSRDDGVWLALDAVEDTPENRETVEAQAETFHNEVVEPFLMTADAAGEPSFQKFGGTEFQNLAQ